MLSETSKIKINSEIAKYPQGHSRAAVMAALRIGQQELGWVSPDLMEHVAEILDIEPIKVAEVATFYTMYDLEPTGRHKISVCTNITCTLQGCAKIASHLFKKLGIGFGETTEDGQYTLVQVECLAACAGAPVAMVGTNYHENLTPEKMDLILESLE